MLHSGGSSSARAGSIDMSTAWVRREASQLAETLTEPNSNVDRGPESGLFKVNKLLGSNCL